MICHVHVQHRTVECTFIHALDKLKHVASFKYTVKLNQHTTDYNNNTSKYSSLHRFNILEDAHYIQI